MTPAKSGPTNVVVVDGSNIATEGRSLPSNPAMLVVLAAVAVAAVVLGVAVFTGG